MTECSLCHKPIEPSPITYLDYDEEPICAACYDEVNYHDENDDETWYDM